MIECYMGGQQGAVSTGQMMAIGCMSSEIGDTGGKSILRRAFAAPSLTVSDSESKKVEIFLRWQQGIRSLH